MKKRPNDNPHRRAFIKAYGRPPKPGYHLHHIDGNYSNNSVDNLVELTPKEHYDIHYNQGDWAACILLADAAQIPPEVIAQVYREHGLNCVERQLGIHSPDFDQSANASNIWKNNPPGRKPVTDGKRVIKFRTHEEVDVFLKENPGWYKGIPSHMKQGLKKSKRRLDSKEASLIANNRIKNGTHNFTQQHKCPRCGKVGKGPMMKRWHFDNCKAHDQKYK